MTVNTFIELYVSPSIHTHLLGKLCSEWAEWSSDVEREQLFIAETQNGPVKGRLKWDGSQRILKFIPDKDFDKGAQVTVTLRRDLLFPSKELAELGSHCLHLCALMFIQQPFV